MTEARQPMPENDGHYVIMDIRSIQRAAIGNAVIIIAFLGLALWMIYCAWSFFESALERMRRFF